MGGNLRYRQPKARLRGTLGSRDTARCTSTLMFRLLHFVSAVSVADHRRTRYTIRSQNCSAPPWALVMKLHSSQENRICPPLHLRKLTSQTLTLLMLQVPGCSSLVKSGWAQSPPAFWETVPHPHLMDKQVNLAFQATWLTLESKDHVGSSAFPGL